MDLAAVIFDDAVANRKTQSGPFADIFGGEKWIEYLAQMFGSNASAVVLQTDLNQWAVVSSD